MKRVVVMGLGRFGGGLAAVRWFAGRGDDVLVLDSGDRKKLLPALEEIAPLGVEVKLGEHDPGDFAGADVLVVNPAVPFDSPFVERARKDGAEIVTDESLTQLEAPES